MPLSAHPFDVAVWYNISTNILRDGPFDLVAFPPLWYHYLMIPVAYTYAWLEGFFSFGTIPMASLPATLNFYPTLNIEVIPGMLFNFVVKIPILISDIAITFLLYKIVKELTNNKGLAEKAAFLWFLNPLVIWISAGWGMWDSLPALFSLASFLFLLKKRFAVSAVCLSLAVALKLYPALFFIPILLYIYKISPLNDKRRHC
jgi:Gpi18-like mannosyltransferase